MNYQEFLAGKMKLAGQTGIEPIDLSPIAFPFQRAIVEWSLRKGNSAIFAECGLGKTIMELDWAWNISLHTKMPVLIIAPLAVAGQTVKEGQKFNRPVTYVRSQADVENADTDLVITNYEIIEAFDPSCFGGVVLDESSILKNYTGKTKQTLISMFADVPYKLAGTATPSPNDHLELGNHAEFLGIMRSNEMISRWFINDSMKAGGYRLAKWATFDFWNWVTSWAVCISKPSDLGFDDNGFNLPPLEMIEHVVPVDHTRAFSEIDKHGQRSLFLTGKTSATNMFREKRATLDKRMIEVASIVANIPENEPIVIWVNTNAESDLVQKLIPEAVDVRGNEKVEVKRQKLEDFSDGKTRILVTKPKIAAFGLNWQHCNNFIVASPDHSFEKFYQLCRRFWRFGQERPVYGHMVFAQSEGDIVKNLERKRLEHEALQDGMINAMRTGGLNASDGNLLLNVGKWQDKAEGSNWTLYHGDSCQTIANVASDSIDHSVYSPPFANLYIYSDNLEDMGNCADYDEFQMHYGYLVAEKLRIHKAGSYSAVHCKDLPLYKGRDGAMGLYDFPGDLIKTHLDNGWWFVGWKTIWKDPVIEMQRTKNAGLLWSSAFCERAERARQGMADYVLIFQKPDDLTKPETEMDCDPLPLSVVERCIDLWSNEGDYIISPYHNQFVREAGQCGLMVVDRFIGGDVDVYRQSLMDGRNLVVRISNPASMTALIDAMGTERMVFHSRVALTDGTWLVVFRKWTDEMAGEHVTHDLKMDSHEFVGWDAPQFYDDDRGYSIQVWQRYASPVWYDLEGLPKLNDDIWMDIQQTNVLNYRQAKEANDEKHICPLQLDVIEKSLIEFTKKGDLIYTPFAGIGSELHTAVNMDRRAVGGELKRGYYETAIRYLSELEREMAQPTLFDLVMA